MDNYTVNKIYFTVQNPKLFVEQYDSYFNDLSEVYATNTYSHNDVNYYNIKMDFAIGSLTEKKFNILMDNFNTNHNLKNEVSRATYKYKNNSNEKCYKWINTKIAR